MRPAKGASGTVRVGQAERRTIRLHFLRRLAPRMRPALGCCLLLLALCACVIAPPAAPPRTTTDPPTSAPPSRPAPSPSAPSPSAPSPTPLPTDLFVDADDVVLYPSSGLVSGDLVTFDVIPGNLGQIDPAELTVRIYRETPDGRERLAEGSVGYPAFDGLPRARMTWAWDTSGAEGDQQLLVWLDPDDLIQEGDEDPGNNVATVHAQIQPATQRPAVEVDAAWITATTQCCTFHYLAGTAAERDLDVITSTAERAVSHVESWLGVSLPQRLDIYLASRTIGHGGYAQEDWLVISYLDRHYAGRGIEQVLEHEVTHVVDVAQLADWAPALLREGLAVTVAGGHYRPEPIPQRAAALLKLEWYVPLGELVEDFYSHQHEVGYLEAAALVTFLVEAHGWDEFLDFYTGFARSEDSNADVLDDTLRAHFGAGLAQTEADFVDWLEAHPPHPEHVRDLQDTVRLLDAARRYQQLYEPGAYFWSGWLPDPVAAESRGVTTDLLRHPTAPENIALETMLIAAQDTLIAADFARAEALLDAVEDVLRSGAFAQPLAAEYLAIAQAAAAAGYEAQRITLEARAARVQAVADWPVLVELRLSRSDAGWTLND
jgi:hypothetical protein